MGTIILCEGADYTGKTITSQYLQRVTSNSIYYHSPSGQSEDTEKLYEVIKGVDLDVKLLLLLASNILNINRMNKLKNDGRTVFSDRSMLSMFAYQGMTIPMYQQLKRMFIIPELDVDMVFLFRASNEEIATRYATRSQRDALDEFFIKRVNDVSQLYTEYAAKIYPSEKIVLVDTTSKSSGETCRWCEEYIKLHNRCLT